MISITSYGFRIPKIYSVDVFTDNMSHDAKFIRRIAYTHGCSKLRTGTRERNKMYYTLEFDNKVTANKCAEFIKKCHLYKID